MAILESTTAVMEAPIPLTALAANNATPESQSETNTLAEPVANLVADMVDDDPSSAKTAIVISSVTVVTGLSSIIAGVVTVAIPAIARDVQLQHDLLLW